MQKGQCCLPSCGSPLRRAKNVTDQQFYKETFAQEKRLCFVSFFPGYPDFLVYTLLKTTYQNSGAGSMLRGV